MRWRASRIAAAVGGRLVGPDVEVSGARHDSREVTGGELFVPVEGVRDGHEFIGAALEAGAGAYLTARPPVGGTAIVVDDPETALTTLGRASRARLPDRVIGITGSVGKTSAKDLAAAALRRRFTVAASERSFNNELGVPLTLVNAPDDAEAAVVEMGARGHGHIAELCEVGRPTIAVVTTVELVHTELFGELDDVARAKSELVAALPSSGSAVLNVVNPFVAAMASVVPAGADVITFGSGRGDVWADDVALDDELRPSFRLVTPWGTEDVRLAVRGRHNVMNALAAAGAALAAGAGVAEVAEGLSEASLSPWRMELLTARSGARVLNDSYNAGPASMTAALQAIDHLGVVGRRVAVLGPMAELGPRSADAHREIAGVAHELGIELIAVGAPEYTGAPALHVPDIDAALAALGDLGPDDAVLVKGSRVAGLERLAQALVGR
ncbi:MAG: UDP-N-acetylmuramoyl-tripeptide--D-alanyl-D-alanine ligase [Acidimicrobiales bacterium]